MKLTDRSVHDLLAAFRSSEPTPGGGSASALSGAIGASLLAMVAGLPKPATAVAEELQQLESSGTRLTELALDLEELIARDSEAYDGVVEAYRRPKATDEDKTRRSAAIQAALREAIEAPLDVMRACAEAAAEGSVVSRLGNRNAASDVAVGLELLRAGRKGARLNVEINLGSIKDQQYGEAVRREISESD